MSIQLIRIHFWLDSAVVDTIMDLCLTVCNENYENFNCIYNLDNTKRHFRLKRYDLIADVGKSSLISHTTTPCRLSNSGAILSGVYFFLLIFIHQFSHASKLGL